MKKPNFEAEPMLIEGHKAWHIGKDVDGKEVYQLEKGFLKLKNGKTEYGAEIDEEGNFIIAPEEPETEKEPEKNTPSEDKPKGGKKKNGNAV